MAHALDAFTARHDGFEDVLSQFMSGAEPLFLAVLLGLFLLVPGRWRALGRRAAVAGAASFAVAAALAQVIGRLVDRPRPFVAHPATIHAFLAHAPDAGFPSDHATAAFAIAVAVGARRRSWGAALTVLALVVAVGRVCLGLHYPGDVLAGAVLGAIVALVLCLRPLREPLDRIADRAGRVLDRRLRTAA